MREQLAVAVDRTADKTTTVHTQEHAVFGTPFWCEPHGRHTTRVRLEVAHPARLRRQVAPSLIVVLLAVATSVCPAHVEILYRARFRARHPLLPFRLSHAVEAVVQRLNPLLALRCDRTQVSNSFALRTRSDPALKVPGR